MTEALANNRLVKAFCREQFEAAQVTVKLNTLFRLWIRTGVFESALQVTAGIGSLGILLSVVWFGGRRILVGQQSAGSLLAFMMTMIIISGPMASLVRLYGRLQQSTGAADRLFAILDEPQEEADQPDALPFPLGPGRVDYEDVHFSYTADAPVLRGLSLTIPSGRITALVGPSGSGKTTLALLLYRFYEPQAGTIRIDGAPVDHVALRELRERIGWVPQDPSLFHGTIRENIRYGKLEATDAEVVAAAESANVAEFVARLPDGYETVIGERGVTLSGGQRQRVAIARAVLKNPRILILDEATSALDSQSEMLVREAIERLMHRRTTIIIAHRLTTIQNADKIAVLDRGVVVECGRHDELLTANGHYAQLQRLSLTC